MRMDPSFRGGTAEMALLADSDGDSGGCMQVRRSPSLPCVAHSRATGDSEPTVTEKQSSIRLPACRCPLVDPNCAPLAFPVTDQRVGSLSIFSWRGDRNLANLISLHAGAARTTETGYKERMVARGRMFRPTRSSGSFDPG